MTLRGDDSHLQPQFPVRFESSSEVPVPVHLSVPQRLIRAELNSHSGWEEKMGQENLARGSRLLEGTVGEKH